MPHNHPALPTQFGPVNTMRYFFLCETCARPKITMDRPLPGQPPRQQYECSVNQYCPQVRRCDQYERAPGTDDFIGEPDTVYYNEQARPIPQPK